MTEAPEITNADLKMYLKKAILPPVVQTVLIVAILYYIPPLHTFTQNALDSPLWQANWIQLSFAVLFTTFLVQFINRQEKDKRKQVKK